MNMEIDLKRYYAETSKGPYLSLNEDGVLVDLDNQLFSVFDGFGGSGIGDECVQIVETTLRENYGMLTSDPDATLPIFYSEKYSIESNALINTMLLAHEKVITRNNPVEISQRGGTSTISAVFADGVVQLFGTGNCIAIKASKENISPVMLPDSRYEFSFFNKELTHSQFPMSAIGLFSLLHYQIREVPVVASDRIFLMSDGAYSRLSGVELSVILNRRECSLREITTEILSLANDRGNKDNQSVLILEF